jgi:membrane associated rhomboid family serine protease
MAVSRRRRFGFRRLPVVTGVVFAVTATTSILQFAAPGMLEALQRTPQGLHGDWWRTFTALLVQDGGMAGTVSNLAFLLVIGVVAEQVLAPWQWLVCYLGTGLAAELVGYAWQPTGAGNSIAICGLAGALAVALALEDPRVPWPATVLLLYWCGALLGEVWTPWLVIYVAAGVLLPAVGHGRLDDRLTGRIVAAATAVAAVILLAAASIHGAALGIGIAIAGVMARPPRSLTRGITARQGKFPH